MNVVGGLFLAALMILLSALGAIYAKHEARRMFVELSVLHDGRDELIIDWGRLQLEQQSLAGVMAVDNLARGRLSMVAPDPSTVVYVRP